MNPRGSWIPDSGPWIPDSRPIDSGLQTLWESGFQKFQFFFFSDFFFNIWSCYWNVYVFKMHRFRLTKNAYIIVVLVIVNSVFTRPHLNAPIWFSLVWKYWIRVHIIFMKSTFSKTFRFRHPLTNPFSNVSTFLVCTHCQIRAFKWKYINQYWRSRPKNIHEHCLLQFRRPYNCLLEMEPSSQICAAVKCILNFQINRLISLGYKYIQYHE